MLLWLRLLLLLLLLLRLNLVEVSRQPVLTIRVVGLTLSLLSLVAGKRWLRLLGIGRERGSGAGGKCRLAGERGLGQRCGKSRLLGLLRHSRQLRWLLGLRWLLRRLRDR